MSFRRLTKAVALVLAVSAVGACANAFAGKPADAYSPNLGVSWPAAAATTTSSPSSTAYIVAGCGFSSSFGGVTIVVHSPVAISFAGQMPDANGCISLSNFYTVGAGHYQIDAYQTMRNKSTVVASTSFDV
jgi:hypothetical protein